MTPTSLFLKKIGYPLTGLISVNAKMMLLSRRVAAPLIIALIPVLLVLIMRIVVFIFSGKEEFHTGDPFEIYSVMCATMYLQFIVPMLALLRGITTFSEEVREKTITFLFLRPMPRWVLATGKYLGSLVTMTVLLASSMILVFLTLGSMPGADIIRGDMPVLLKDICILSLGVAAYGAVMMFIGSYFRRSLMIGIMLIFVWDAFAAYIPGFAHKLTIKFYLQCIFPHQEARTTINVVKAFLSNHVPVSETYAVMTLLLIIVSAIGLTTLALKHREYVGEGVDNE